MQTKFKSAEERVTPNGTKPAKPITMAQWSIIVDALTYGCTLEDAAHLARIGYGRLLRNIDAEKHLEKDVKEIMTKCKLHHLKKIYDGEKGWQASAWFLERVYRKQFALIDKQQEDEERAIQMRKVVREQGVRPLLSAETN